MCMHTVSHLFIAGDWVHPRMFKTASPLPRLCQTRAQAAGMNSTSRKRFLLRDDDVSSHANWVGCREQVCFAEHLVTLC